MNKRSMAYKRALFIEQFDKMLRQDELKILKDPKRRALYRLEERNVFGKENIFAGGPPVGSVAVNVGEAETYPEERTDFMKQEANF